MCYLYTYPYIFEITSKSIYTATILAPVGKLSTNEITIPHTKQTTAIIHAIIIILLKLFVSFLDIIAGKTIKLEINNVPIILIPITTTKAAMKDIKNW